MTFPYSFVFSSSSCEVQCGHLVAAIAISDLQKGQVLVVGALGGSSL